MHKNKGYSLVCVNVRLGVITQRAIIAVNQPLSNLWKHFLYADSCFGQTLQCPRFFIISK